MRKAANNPGAVRQFATPPSPTPRRARGAHRATPRRRARAPAAPRRRPPERPLEVGPAREPAASVAPGAAPRVDQRPSGRHAAPARARRPQRFAGAAGALEPHPPAQRRPVRRIQRAQLTPDRHRWLRAGAPGANHWSEARRRPSGARSQPRAANGADKGKTSCALLSTVIAGPLRM